MTRLEMKDFINDEIVEKKVNEICKAKNIKFDDCVKDLVIKAFSSQTNFDNTIKGVVNKRDFEIICNMYFIGMSYKGLADKEGISTTRVRQLLCRGVRNMRIRLKIYLGRMGGNI